MRSKFIDKLVQDDVQPVIWAITAQPARLAGTGWKEVEKLQDGAIYSRQGGPLVAFRGIEDKAGRRWMLLSAGGCEPTMELARELRTTFFPNRAIVSVAVCPDERPMLEMWWAVDGDGLPMDEGWKIVMRDLADDDPEGT